MPVKIICRIILVLGVGALLAIPMLASAASPAQSATTGEATFKARCTACHTIGAGKLVGPDLKGVTQRRDVNWLSNWIKSPDKVLASADPIATKLLAEYNNIPMPNLALSDADVADLIAYFQSVDGLSSAPTKPTQAVASLNLTAATQASAPASQTFTTSQAVLMLNGDPQYGEQIFTGVAALQKGGTHCMACHTVNGVGPFGGGALGPDLTHVYTRYGRQGLAAALGTLPFPTMQGVFTNKMLTDSEQADLLAFFERADRGGSPQTRQNLLILLAGSSGLVMVLLVGLFLFWPRQSMSIAQRLRKNGKI